MTPTMHNIFPNTELLPSHLGIEWPLGFENQPYIDLSNMSCNEYKLIILMISMHGRSIDPTIKYNMNGIMQSLFPNADDAIKNLQQRGYFRDPTIKEVISSQTISQLKELAKTLNIHIPSKLRKAEIIELFFPHFDSKVISNYIKDKKWFILSEKGLLMAKSLYVERENVERQVYDNFYNDNIKGAIATWSKYRSRQCGTKIDVFDNFQPIIISDKKQSAILACYDLFGTKPMFYPTESPTEAAIFEMKCNRSLKQLNDYKNSGFEQYYIVSTLDVNTCKKCAELDGKIFNINETMLSINLPPFHYNCRCHFTVIINDFLPLGNSTRWARNPLTGKDMYTNATTYFEWERSLTEEERTKLIKTRGW